MLLADMLGVSERTVRRAQKQLESLELIHCEQRGNNMGRAAKASRFLLTMPPENTGHGTPDTDKNTGHGCPEHRTSVTGTPDTGVRLIHPLLDPGNRPGSVVVDKADTDMSAHGHEASISDDRPDASRLMGVTDTNYEHGPEGAAALVVEADTVGVRPVDELTTQPSKGDQQMNDPFANDPCELTEDQRAIMEEFYSSEATETQREPVKPVDQFSLDLERDYRKAEEPRTTPWPTGKPFVRGEFDPFANYVDAETGEPLTP
jgi:hypothetical protein